MPKGRHERDDPRGKLRNVWASEHRNASVHIKDLILTIYYLWVIFFTFS